jgi:hypothetical protein
MRSASGEALCFEARHRLFCIGTTRAGQSDPSRTTSTLPREQVMTTEQKPQTVVKMGWGGITSASYSRWLSSSSMCLSPARETRRMLSPVASSPIPGFIRSGGLAASAILRGRVSGSLTLQLTCSPRRTSSVSITPAIAGLARCRTGNSHDDLLFRSLDLPDSPDAPERNEFRRDP